MAGSRKGKNYKQYLQAYQERGSNIPIPSSTWRRWLVSGRITEDQLKELGIKTNVRRRRGVSNAVQEASQRAEIPNIPVASPERNVEEMHEHRAISPLTTDFCPSSDETDSIQSGFSGRSEEPLTQSSNGYSFSSTYSSNSDESDGEEGLEEDALSENMRLASLLRSKHIGPIVLNGPVHPNLSISKFEVLLLILHLSLRHRMTDVFVEHLLEVVEKIVGVPNVLGVSKHLFHKLFKFGKKPDVHFYCPNCNVYIGPEDRFNSGLVSCDKILPSGDLCSWSSTVSSLNGGNYFLKLELRSQLRDVLNRPGLLLAKQERCGLSISDIMDGKEYQRKSKNGNILSNKNALTLTMSTDGSPVFKSGPNSLWPVHFYINEIDPQERFRAENIMLGGVWFGQNEANIDILMTPIVAELRELEETGIIWKGPDGKRVESKVYVLCCCADSVARPKIQKHMQFNGAYGCSLCLHPNSDIVVVENVKRAVVRNYGNSDATDDPCEIVRERKMLRYVRGAYEMRSNKQLRDHMYLAQHSQYDHIMGSKGLSALYDLKHFNVVFGFPIDYMHAVLLGTVRRTVNLWFDSTSSGQPYYIGLAIDRINIRMTDVTLPSGFRPPRKMSERVHWKANEWRAFLLYFSLPVLNNILPSQFFCHFKKLVSAVYILTKETILDDEIKEAHSLLQEFVWDYEELYGKINMVYNIHLMGHLAQIVMSMGPLWAYSAFPFESANGRLVKLAMGTKGVATQICRKYLMTKSVSKLISFKYKVRDDVLDLCCKIIGYKYLRNATKCSKSETILGRQFVFPLNDVQKQALQDKNFSSDVVFVANRIIIGGKLYHSRLTTRQHRACDSCVRLKSGEFALIDLIIVTNNLNDDGYAEVAFIITKINVASDPSPLLVPHIKQCSLDSFGDVTIITSDDISRKCIFYSCNDKHYIAEISNFYETD